MARSGIKGYNVLLRVDMKNLMDYADEIKDGGVKYSLKMIKKTA